MSLTAVINALMRAYHSDHDHEGPKIFDDACAAALFAADERAALEAQLVTALAFFDPDAAALGLDRDAALARSMRAQSTPILLGRARWAEDLLAAADGVRQYVILGAGLDTFAWRRPDLLARMGVYEVDHPEAQADKRRRIARAGWTVPDRLRLVPLDLTTGALGAALGAAGFETSLPTFFSWMGVTYYLARDVVIEILRALAALAAPGSRLVFDHLDTGAFDDARASVRIKRTREIVARVGEPMRTGLAPAELAAVLRDTGWRVTEQLAPAELQARYFADRRDGYRALDHFHLAAAERPSVERPSAQ